SRAGRTEPTAGRVAVIGGVVVKRYAANETGYRALRIAGAGIDLELCGRHRQIERIGVTNAAARIRRPALVAVAIAEGLLLDKGQQPHEPASEDAVIVTGRHGSMSALVVGDAQANLLDVVGALITAGSFACRLHSRQKQGHQYADNGDHNQQLNE